MDTDSRDLRLRELQEMLRSRDYGRGLIDTAIQRASTIPRSEALKRVVREKGEIRPVFADTYDPRLPSITNIIRKHYWVMIANDPRLAEVFPHCTEDDKAFVSDLGIKPSEHCQHPMPSVGLLSG